MPVIKEHTTCQFKVNMQWDECGHVEIVLTNSYTYCTIIFKLTVGPNNLRARPNCS